MATFRLGGSTLRNDRSRSPGVLGKGRKLCATCDGIVGSATRVCPHCDTTILAGKRGTNPTETFRTTSRRVEASTGKSSVSTPSPAATILGSAWSAETMTSWTRASSDGLITMEDTSDDDVDDEELARLEEKVTAARGALEEKSKSLREKLALSTAPTVNTSRVGVVAVVRGGLSADAGRQRRVLRARVRSRRAPTQVGAVPGLRRVEKPRRRSLGKPARNRDTKCSYEYPTASKDRQG